MDSTNDEVFEKNFYHLSYDRIYLEIIEKMTSMSISITIFTKVLNNDDLNP